MTSGDLRDRLRDAAVPDEDAARERAWRVVSAAHAARRPQPRRAGGTAVALAAGAVAVIVAFTPPGEAFAQWVRDLVRPVRPPAEYVRPVLGPLPGGGRLLVTASTGAWIVAPDGTRRRLGAYDEATFSPRGLFVAVTRGNLLAAVDPHGRVRWTLTRPTPVTRPTWSPDGFRVAYRSGDELRVVYGDGALDRRLTRRTAGVSPVWRPGTQHRLAAVAPDRRTLVLRDTDTGRVLWRARTSAPVRQLAWSPDGRRLLVVTPAAVRVLAGDGRPVRSEPTLEGMRPRRVAWLPDGRTFAVVRWNRAGTGSDVVLVGAARRQVIAVRGRLADVLTSPDGRWLLLSAPDAGQWLLVRTSGPGHLTALSRVGRQFDPGGRGPAALPRLDAWIR